MGIYVFNAEFLYEQLIRDADDPKSSHDFGKDMIPALRRPLSRRSPTTSPTAASA